MKKAEAVPKKPYGAPKLTNYGKLADIVTQSKGKNNNESGGTMA